MADNNGSSDPATAVASAAVPDNMAADGQQPPASSTSSDNNNSRRGSIQLSPSAFNALRSSNMNLKSSQMDLSEPTPLDGAPLSVRNSRARSLNQLNNIVNSTTDGSSSDHPENEVSSTSSDPSQQDSTSTGMENEEASAIEREAALKAAEELVSRQRKIDTICDHLSKVITLSGYSPAEMWTEQHKNAAKDFFLGSGRRRLFAFVGATSTNVAAEDSDIYSTTTTITNSPALYLQSNLPDRNVNELMYFIIEATASSGSSDSSDGSSTSNAATTDSTSQATDALQNRLSFNGSFNSSITSALNIPTLTDFEKKVQYGTIEGSIMESLLRLMQGVYVPIFSENQQWSESVRKDFVGQMHKFMAVLTVKTSLGFFILFCLSYLPSFIFPGYHLSNQRTHRLVRAQ